MSDLGALLRKAREQRGYTLDDIQETTKIRKRYLEAIETGDYKVLPGSFYVRAFVKTYAETVGLDAEEVLRLYQKELPKVAEPETAAIEPMMHKSRRVTQHNDRIGKVTVTLLMWLFPIVIVAVIYIYFSNNADSNPDEVTPRPITEETATPAPPATVQPTGSALPGPADPATESPPSSLSPVTLTLIETRRNVQYVEVSPSGPHKLEIEVTGRCWIGIKEGSSSGKSLLSKGFEEEDVPQTLSFDLTGPLYINVGRSDNVRITIDGTLFDDGDEAGSTKVVFIPAEG